MKTYIKADPWKVIEPAYEAAFQKISESLFSIGNGRFGQRANFEETFTGPTLPGNYIAGVYYPDTTRVGWWKNGYPDYFAKVLNAPDWIALKIEADGVVLDLNQWNTESFRRVLDMQTGILHRQAKVSHPSGGSLSISSQRMCHNNRKDLGALQYIIEIGKGIKNLKISSYVEGDVTNDDANYDEQFWEGYDTGIKNDSPYLAASTKKTGFRVGYALRNRIRINNRAIKDLVDDIDIKRAGQLVSLAVNDGDRVVIEKYVGIKSSRYVAENDIITEALAEAQHAVSSGFDVLVKEHSQAWSDKWAGSDIVIKGDDKAQQGIRFNIFQLHQTYSGDDPRLNIGPKGFTGEKYGGSTYWDTEAYCLPFYLSTAGAEVGRNLLVYRHQHLEKAIENAEKLGFKNGAALYPMVTMNGEECHNEWEITFEEIHRNGAIAYAIYDYTEYTGDQEYLLSKGIEVLIAIARFWVQRVHWSKPKECYVMHGVTGPNEYENNINNNWYTNYIARWCLSYSADVLDRISRGEGDLGRLKALTDISPEEWTGWRKIAEQIYLPVDEETRLILQQEGYLDKEILPVTEIPHSERPINQHWSWDRILRSCYIKQADVLQGLYFFEHHFEPDTIRRNFEFYEPLTVHESSLSPCVHSILASSLGLRGKAYEMYLRTARLDLDDYNNDTEDGCHITSMAGTWLAIVKGFAGMRMKEGRLSFKPFCPENWESYNFQIRWREQLLDIHVDQKKITIRNQGPAFEMLLNDSSYRIPQDQTQNIPL